MNVAGAIGTTLVAEGVEVVFSLLGEATMHMVDSLASQGVRVVECRHEAAALAMADGYSRASGRPAVCAVTTGPAFAHTLVPLASAGRTHSQVIVLTGLRKLDDLEDRQRMDHQAIARLAGVAYRPLVDPDSAVERVREVVDLARSEGRPVVLDVAQEVQTQPFEWDIEQRPTPAWRKPQRIHPDPAVVTQALALLASARRPVILAGSGALHAQARDELVALAGECGALLTTTLDAKGLFDGDPYNAGIAGLYSSDTVMTLVADADCVVSFGASLNSHTLAKGYLFPKAKIVQVDTAAPHPMGTGQAADCYVQADALATAVIFRQMLRARAEPAAQANYRTAQVAELLATQVIDPALVDVDPGTLDPRQVCREIDEMLPAECGFATGLSGHFWSFGALHMVRRRTPMLNSTYVGAIGYGVPVGIGAALADPLRPLVCLEGDGSVMMHIHALETAARHKVRILVVVMNNEALGAEYYKMRLSGLDESLSVAQGLDIAGIASAMGCTATTARTMDQLRESVTKFLNGSGPHVIDARLSREVMSRTFRRANLGEA